MIISVSLSILFFNVWNVAIYPICEKLLTESHRDIVCIAGSKQHIDHPSSEATTMDKIFEADSSFHVKQRITGKVQFLFSSSLLLVSTRFPF